MSLEKLNHTDLANKRLITQYKESKNLKAYISAFLSESEKLEQVFNDLLCVRWIDSASGANLDVIGEIVGQPRTVFDSTSLLFFGFDTSVNSGTFGDATNASVGERFRSEEEAVTGNVTFADPEYRLLLKGKILANRTTCTVDDVARICTLLFGANTYVNDAPNNEDMTSTILVNKVMDSTEKTLAGIIIPRPAGVKYIYRDSNGQFVPGT